jgi:hypothetical protein
MGFVRGFLFFWYDFLVGDAWDIAAGVVVCLVALALVARAAPGSASVLGPLLAVAVIALTWLSLSRETRRR